MAAKTKNVAGTTPAAEKPKLGIFDTEIPDNVTRRNTPVLVNHADVAVGATISGEIIAVLDSPTSTIKGSLLHLRHASGQEYTFPATGSVRTALAPGKALDETKAALAKEIGKTVYIKRLADKAGGKQTYLFDVYTTAK